VVVESTEPVVAIANNLGNSPQYMASTESFDAGATSVNLPLIMRGNAGYYTWFNVQNAGTTDATVSVQYIPAEGSAYTEPNVVIKPGASHTFNQRDIDALGAKLLGSAIVSSDVPVVATVMQVGETFQNMLGYNGFTTGSATVSLPLIMSNNNGFYTGIQIQNVGSEVANVTVDYGTNIGGSFNPADDTATLDPGESTTFLQNTGQFEAPKYVGSATITSNQPVVAIVNQVLFGGAVLGTAYGGFDPGTATNSVSAPLIMANNSGFYTVIQVMNVGSGAIDITLDYGPNTAGTYNPPNETATIQPGDSYNSIQNAGAWEGNKYVGSASVAAAEGGQIVMIVNEYLPSGTDTFMTYNGFNY